MLSSRLGQTTNPPRLHAAGSLLSAGYCRRICRTDYRITCNQPREPGYSQARDLVREVFHTAYDAHCSRFLPFLMSLCAGDQPNGVLGMKPAGMGELYMEQYLDQPVEQAVSRCFQQPVARQQLIEIGNLVVKNRGVGKFMFAVLGTLLARTGVRYIVFTATPQVQAMMQSIRWPTREVCAADASRLSDSDSHWGRYYETNPRVLVGDILEASEYLSDPNVKGLVAPYSTQIDHITRLLCSAIRNSEA